MLDDSPDMFLAASITFCDHLGLGLGVGTVFGSGSLWNSSSISSTDSIGSSTSDSEFETLMETLSYAKGLGKIVLPSL